MIRLILYTLIGVYMYNFSNDAHVGFAPFIVLDLSPSCPVCVGPLSLHV